MEKLSCSVAINGDIRAVITKPHVTVAEIVLLQAMHGSDAVFNIKVIGQLDSNSEQERDRLGNFYKDAKVMEVFGQYGELPTTLAESRIEDTLLDPVWLSEKKKKPAPKKKAAKPTKKRARDSKGHYIADDPTTEVNEAFVEE